MDSEADDDSNDIILAIIGHNEEQVQSRGSSSRSGRSLNKRFDSEYFYFKLKKKECKEWCSLFVIKTLSSNSVNIKL